VLLVLAGVALLIYAFRHRAGGHHKVHGVWNAYLCGSVSACSR
jgi:hypothetical protein